jgi:excisionase family DNA binding protein
LFPVLLAAAPACAVDHLTEFREVNVPGRHLSRGRERRRTPPTTRCGKEELWHTALFMTVQETAALLRQSERSIRRKIHAGEIPALRLSEYGPLRIDPLIA